MLLSQILRLLYVDFFHKNFKTNFNCNHYRLKFIPINILPLTVYYIFHVVIVFEFRLTSVVSTSYFNSCFHLLGHLTYEKHCRNFRKTRMTKKIRIKPNLFIDMIFREKWILVNLFVILLKPFSYSFFKLYWLNITLQVSGISESCTFFINFVKSLLNIF